MKLIKKAGTLSFHCREREIVVALWSQPHAFPSSLWRMTLPGRSSRTLPFDRGPCTNSLLGPGRTHTYNYTSRPPLSTLWFLRPWRVWDICDSLTHSPLHFYPLCLCLCSAHRIVAPILNCQGQRAEHSWTWRTESIAHAYNTHISHQIRAFKCKTSFLDVQKRSAFTLHQPIAHTQPHSFKICIFQTKRFLNSPLPRIHCKIAFLLFLANPCEHASSLHHCSEISMALLFTHDFFDGPSLLHERFNFEKFRWAFSSRCKFEKFRWAFSWGTI